MRILRSCIPIVVAGRNEGPVEHVYHSPTSSIVDCTVRGGALGSHGLMELLGVDSVVAFRQLTRYS